MEKKGDYTVTAVKDGYEEGQPQRVSVVEDILSTEIVNFTLTVDKSKEWSDLHDFGLAPNLNAKWAAVPLVFGS